MQEINLKSPLMRFFSGTKHKARKMLGRLIFWQNWSSMDFAFQKFHLSLWTSWILIFVYKYSLVVIEKHCFMYIISKIYNVVTSCCNLVVTRYFFHKLTSSFTWNCLYNWSLNGTKNIMVKGYTPRTCF